MYLFSSLCVYHVSRDSISIEIIFLMSVNVSGNSYSFGHSFNKYLLGLSSVLSPFICTVFKRGNKTGVIHSLMAKSSGGAGIKKTIAQKIYIFSFRKYDEGKMQYYQ